MINKQIMTYTHKILLHLINNVSQTITKQKQKVYNIDTTDYYETQEKNIKRCSVHYLMQK